MPCPCNLHSSMKNCKFMEVDWEVKLLSAGERKHGHLKPYRICGCLGLPQSDGCWQGADCNSEEMGLFEGEP